jgi:hypothetical protein
MSGMVGKLIKGACATEKNRDPEIGLAMIEGMLGAGSRARRSVTAARGIA